MRFSTLPSLSLRAVIIEIVRAPNGRGRGTLFFVSGHWREGYRLESSRNFTLSRHAYSTLVNRIDAELSSYRPTASDPNSNGEQLVCTDGPGYATERVRGGAILTLTGFCPATFDTLHPNRRIAQILEDLICRQYRGSLWVDLHGARPRRQCPMAGM